MSALCIRDINSMQRVFSSSETKEEIAGGLLSVVESFARFWLFLCISLAALVSSMKAVISVYLKRRLNPNSELDVS